MASEASRRARLLADKGIQITAYPAQKHEPRDSTIIRLAWTDHGIEHGVEEAILPNEVRTAGDAIDRMLGKAEEISSSQLHCTADLERDAARWRFIRGYKDNLNLSAIEIYEALSRADIDLAVDTLMDIAEARE